MHKRKCLDNLYDIASVWNKLKFYSKVELQTYFCTKKEFNMRYYSNRQIEKAGRISARNPLDANAYIYMTTGRPTGIIGEAYAVGSVCNKKKRVRSAIVENYSRKILNVADVSNMLFR